MSTPKIDPDWIDDLVAVERYLLEHTDVKTNQAAQLPIDADESRDPAKWQTIIGWLLERGWRIAPVDDVTSGLLFYAPGPLSDPGNEVRMMN